MHVGYINPGTHDRGAEYQQRPCHHHRRRQGVVASAAVHQLRHKVARKVSLGLCARREGRAPTIPPGPLLGGVWGSIAGVSVCCGRNSSWIGRLPHRDTVRIPTSCSPETSDCALPIGLELGKRSIGNFTPVLSWVACCCSPESGRVHGYQLRKVY